MSGFEVGRLGFAGGCSAFTGRGRVFQGGGAMGVSWTVDQVAEVARIKGIVMAKVRIEVEAMVE